MKLYNIAFFSKAYMEASEARDSGNWEAYRTENLGAAHDLLIGPRRRGTYTDREKAINLLETRQDLYALHEGYYDYALIETVTSDEIDPFDYNFDNPEESELWYKWSNESSSYVRIKKPRFLKGVVSFS